MWKPLGPILGCCFAAMPLIGCVGGFTAMPPQAGAPSAAVADTIPEQGVYTARVTMPVAVLVFMPGTVELRDLLTRDPALWTAQDFDLVLLRSQWADRLIADHQAAVERLLASAQALANAPIWLVGPSPAVEAVIPRLGPGQVSGVVVTSVTSSAGSCGKTMYYSNRGNGAEPMVMVKTSGDACGASPSFGARTPAGVVPAPQVKPGFPRLIEASIPADHIAQRPVVQRLAEEIKTPPAS